MRTRGAGAEWLTPIFAGFLEKHSHIILEVPSSDKTVDIVGDGFGLAIRGGQFADSDLLARRLTTGKDWTFSTADGVRSAPAITGRFETDSGAMVCKAAMEGVGIGLLRLPRVRSSLTGAL